MPFETSSQEIKTLALKLSAVTDRIEDRLNQVSQQTLAAAQGMVHNAQQAQEISQGILHEALSEFRRAASDAVGNGMRGAVAGYENTLNDSACKLADGTSKLEWQMRTASAAHLATAWKAFIALTIAAIAVIAVAGYLVWQARDSMKETQWVQEINEAIVSGKLIRCPEGGLCAMVKKRWQRLDP